MKVQRPYAIDIQGKIQTNFRCERNGGRGLEILIVEDLQYAGHNRLT